MSPTLKDLETTLSRILSHAKLCRCLIHLPLFPLPTNNIMAVVSDVQKQKIGMGMTLATQQHLLASSARTAIPECMNAQSLIISQKEEVTRREWCICFVVHTGCFMPVCSQNPQGFKGVHGNPSPHRCHMASVIFFYDYQQQLKLVESFQKLFPTILHSPMMVFIVVLIRRWKGSMEVFVKA